MRKFICFFLLISSILSAQKQPEVDLSTPKATLYTHIYFLMPQSYDITKSAKTIKGLPRAEAEIAVQRIKAILDGRGLVIDFSELPEDPDYVDTLNFKTSSIDHNKNRYAPFPIRLPEIYVEKSGNNWYYSEETLGLINQLYDKTFPIEFSWLSNKYPDFFRATLLGILIWKPIALLVTLVICIILYYVLEPFIFFILKHVQKIFSRKSSSGRMIKILHELARPFVFIILLRMIKNILPSFQLVKWNAVLITGLRIAETVFWVMVFLKLSKTLLNMYHEYNKEGKSKLDRQLAPLLNKVIQGVVILVGFLHVLTVFGVDPTTVLAGASIGGIAIAFAAQDSVKNLIGTMVIFLDKPFQLDDWVSIDGVEGAVEKVGFRSTKIRAADTTLYQIPNSKISEADINNKGLRILRRYSTELGVRYDTPPELIEAFIDGIKRIIVLHPSTKSQAYNVDFIAYGASSLNILVNVYFKGLDWGEEQASKHILHLAILKLAASLGVEFAFPSTTMMIEQFPGQGFSCA